MDKSISVLLLFPVFALSLAGCSAIRTDPTQKISLATNPGGANCELSREGKVVGAVNPTPGDIVVDRNKHEMSVLCKKDGYQDASGTVKSGIAGTVFWNVLAMDPIGIAVDAATGADNSYSGSTTITLVPIDDLTSPASPEITAQNPTTTEEKKPEVH